jgi:hypothetical protein
MRESTTTAAEAQAVQAYGAALDALGLEWAWDPQRHGAGPAGLRAYLEQEHPHLLRVYDIEFLVEAVESTRARLERAR